MQFVYACAGVCVCAHVCMCMCACSDVSILIVHNLKLLLTSTTFPHALSPLADILNLRMLIHIEHGHVQWINYQWITYLHATFTAG